MQPSSPSHITHGATDCESDYRHNGWLHSCTNNASNIHQAIMEANHWITNLNIAKQKTKNILLFPPYPAFYLLKGSNKSIHKKGAARCYRKVDVKWEVFRQCQNPPGL